MRDPAALLGLLLLHALLAATGLSLLTASALVPLRPMALAAALGPAFLIGLVVTGVITILLLVVGISPGVAVPAVVALGLALAGGLITRRRPRATVEPKPRDKVGRTVGAGLLLVAALLVVFGVLALANLPVFWDDANIWSLKGVTLYHHDGLVDEVFRNPLFTYVHLDYPILLPMLESWFFHAIGGVDLRLWHVEVMVVFATAIWTIAWLLNTLGGRPLWVLPIAYLVLSQIVSTNLTLADADAVMAAILACGVLSLGLWLQRGALGYACFGALLLGGAANVKNEGFAFGVVVLAALGGVVLASRLRSHRRGLLLATLTFVVAIAPWLAWVGTNPAAQRATRSPADVLSDPGDFGDRLSTLWRGVEQVATQMVTLPSWWLVVPVFLAVAGSWLVVGPYRPVAAFYLLAWLLSACVIAYTYWVTPISDIVGFETRTGPRIVLGVVFIAGVGLAHLLALTPAVSLRQADRAQSRAAVPQP